MKPKEFLISETRWAVRCSATVVVAAATALGCSRTETGQSSGTAAAASGSAPAMGASAAAPHAKIPGIVNGLPIPDAQVQRHVNPTKLPVYDGPTATLRGVVTMTGDPPPERPQVVEKIGDACKASRGVYGRLFREGMLRAVADALVVVTGYTGRYVPPERETVSVVGRDCAWDRLTIGMMFGQRLEITSRGSESYMPELVGAPSKAHIIALPRGSAVRLYPTRPGPYPLVDRMHPTMTASVFVINVPTFDVTGLDGRYQIARVPPGEVSVSATLPQINKSVRKTLRVEGGKTYDVDLQLAFDADKDVPKPTAPADAKKKPTP